MLLHEVWIKWYMWNGTCITNNWVKWVMRNAYNEGICFHTHTAYLAQIETRIIDNSYLYYWYCKENVN